MQLLRLDNEYSQRVANVVDAIRAQSPVYQQLYPCKEGDRLEPLFFAQLIQDRTPAGHSYPEFLRGVPRGVMTRVQR